MPPSVRKKITASPDLPEILAPAGDHESLAAALGAGADAVYFGVDQLNMRAGAVRSFTVEDLPRIALRCHKNNAKAYLTLNTILYEHDLPFMRSIADAAKKAGIDALICSDIAAIQYAQRINIPVHISTQCNITNLEAVKFYASYAEVMVLSRELTLGQVREICSEIKRNKIKSPSGNNVRIEVFAHGALCMAVSGKCHLSLHSHHASANRGACVQNCRREYIVTDKESGDELEVDGEYIFSAKDLCTIPFLDQLVRAGISVLKIEGRGRSADYVHTATRCYKEAVEAIRDGTFNREKSEAWLQRLSSVFNRGFWEGYYLGRHTGEWSKNDGSLATQRKIYVGKGRKYFPRPGVGEFLVETHDLHEHDRIMIMGPTTGYFETTVDELRVNGVKRTEAGKGDIISIKVPQKIRPSDKLYKVVVAPGS